MAPAIVSTERVTHEVPAFSRTKDMGGYVFQQTCCGLFVGWTAVAPVEQEPTCPACRGWLGLDCSVEMFGGRGGYGVVEPESRCLYCGQPMPDEAMNHGEFTYCSSACENAARTE